MALITSLSLVPLCVVGVLDRGLEPRALHLMPVVSGAISHRRASAKALLKQDVPVKLDSSLEAEHSEPYG